MAYADRVSEPFPGRLPSEFIRPPVLPKTTITAPRDPAAQTDGSRGGPRRSAADVRLPCMVYAAVGVLPLHSSADPESAIMEARKSPGVVQVISSRSASRETAGAVQVAVVARGYWLARQALARLMERCDAPYMTALAKDAACASRVTHATAQFVGARLRLWMASSNPEETRALAASLSGVAEEYVDLRVTGEADGTTSLEVVTAALALAKELQPAPVQVILAPLVALPLPPVAFLAGAPDPGAEASASPQALAA